MSDSNEFAHETRIKQLHVLEEIEQHLSNIAIEQEQQTAIMLLAAGYAIAVNCKSSPLACALELNKGLTKLKAALKQQEEE